MTAFMGFDRAPLQALQDAMRRSVQQLDAIRSADAEALVAIHTVRRLQRELVEGWIPLIGSLLECGALTGYVPSRLGLGDLTESRLGVLQSLYGWSVVTDPLAPLAELVTLDQAQSLGWLLSHGDVSELVSAAELAWLDSTLAAIAQRPALADAFLSNMTTDGWTRLCNRLGDDRISALADQTIAGHLDDDARSRLASIDTVFASLGTLLVGDHARHPAHDPLARLTGTNPYGAAMLARYLQLGSDELAATATRLIERYREGGWADVQRAGPGTADILMQTIIATPGAATAFVLRNASAPEVIFDSAHDAGLAQRLFLFGTNPAHMTVTEAGTVIPSTLHYLRDRYNSQAGFYGQADTSIASFSIDLAAPWLLQFTATHSRDWGLVAGDGARLLASVVGDDSSLAHLASRRDDIAAGLTARIADHPDPSRSAVGDLAAMLGLIDTLARQHTISRTAGTQQLWDIAFVLIGSTTSFIPGGIEATAGAGVAIAGLRAVLKGQGITPQDGGSVAHDTLYALDWLTTVAAATVVCATFDQMVRDGSIRKDAPPPPLPDPHVNDPGAQYSAAFDAWLDRADLGREAVVLNALRQTIASTHEAERNATDLATG